MIGPDKALEQRDILKFNKHVSADTQCKIYTDNATLQL